MSNLAGYKSVLLAADHINKLLPMMTTAAGTILPAKVIVIGAGVAGLQAIATARRLGAVVLAFDTRPATEEQVKSLGAGFVKLETSPDAEDKGGYAKEQSKDFYHSEQQTIAEHLNDTDIIITTALIPGKKAPLLITENMVKMMKPGSVIVDLAAEQGGNCALTKIDETIQIHHITIIGKINLPSMVAVHASQLYAKNCLAFLNYVLPQIKTRSFDQQDEIIANCLLTHDKKVMQERFDYLVKESI